MQSFSLNLFRSLLDIFTTKFKGLISEYKSVHSLFLGLFLVPSVAQTQVYRAICLDPKHLTSYASNSISYSWSKLSWLYISLYLAHSILSNPVLSKNWIELLVNARPLSLTILKSLLDFCFFPLVQCVLSKNSFPCIGLQSELSLNNALNLRIAI